MSNSIDQNTMRTILLNSVQGGDVDANGNLIAKVSLMKLFQQFGSDITFSRITLDGDTINLYILSTINWQPIDVGNGITLDLRQYAGTTVIKIPIKKKFLDDLTQIANLPIVGVEQVNVNNTTDVVIKINTGKKMTATTSSSPPTIDF
ncbi:hypothetical protein [Deltalipothrixvirus pozzuoliense]|uniref:Uncharacterized protein ORF147 n=1 Tax=Acidianus filamentous virus 2 (isolate Italy/Pozzuoli) TaxID=654910 RepID=Y147_AFV2P|nr:hypothetical protein AFV2_gp39 [Acidianus filamentous virus 2]Q573D0.1 RecName: Full=Uncharacterized protein ORF147 [Acidianus filamentous virus 2 (isolate Pozzuoli)]CAH69426.1 hypothetical protein [Acidianus filamentous virus 2]